jgi:hypothetical protein
VVDVISRVSGKYRLNEAERLMLLSSVPNTIKDAVDIMYRTFPTYFTAHMVQLYQSNDLLDSRFDEQRDSLFDSFLAEIFPDPRIPYSVVGDYIISLHGCSDQSAYDLLE